MEHIFSKLNPIKYTVLLILSFILSTIISIPVIRLSGGLESAMLIFITSLSLYTFMLLLLWRMSLTGRDRYLIMKPAPARSRRNALFVLGPFLWSLPINILFVLFTERFFPGFYEKMTEATNLPQNMGLTSDPISLTLIFLAVVVMAPICEEMIFRGVLYNLLNKYIPLFPAALLSSAVFGLLHGTTFFQTAAIGLILAFIYQVTGDIKMSMLGHAVNNGLALAQGILMERGIVVAGETSETILTSMLIGCASIYIIITLFYLRRNSLSSIYKDRSPVYKHKIRKRTSQGGTADGQLTIGHQGEPAES